jgi:hypothetical protein
MRGWKLSLAMMAVLPLIVVSMGILATVMKSSGEVTVRNNIPQPQHEPYNT